MPYPAASLVHDKFHIAKYLGEAVDKVRRSEHRELKKEGDSPLTGLRQLLLYNEENLDEDAYYEVLTIQRADLKTGRAWAIKENFRHFGDYRSRAWGRRYFDRWYARVDVEIDGLSTCRRTNGSRLMREITSPIRLGDLGSRPNRLLLKLVALRRAELAVRTDAGSERIRGRPIVPNLDSDRPIRRQTGRK